MASISKSHKRNKGMLARIVALDYLEWLSRLTYIDINLDISAEEFTHTINPGETATYIISYFNLQNDTKEMTLTTSLPSEGWTVSLSQNSFTLEPYETVNIMVNVTAPMPQNVQSGHQEFISITANWNDNQFGELDKSCTLVTTVN